MAKNLKLGILALAIAFTATACGDDPGTKYVSFAQCLTKKGAKMYGAYWCPHCANQKRMFGKEGIKEILYIECDPRGEDAKTGLCLEKNIKGYPTWEFADGSKIEGEISFDILAGKIGCKLPEEASS